MRKIDEKCKSCKLAKTNTIIQCLNVCARPVEALEKIEDGKYRAVKHGHWVIIHKHQHYFSVECSECRLPIEDHTVYKPHEKYRICFRCGAIMDGGTS